MSKKEDFDEESLKDHIVEKKSNFYSNICKDYNQSPLNMVVEFMFKVIDAQVDGFEDTFSVKIALYHVFGGKELLMVDKYVNLNILLTRYESYLKKIYYLIHGEALKRPFDEGNPTLMDAIMAFPSIRALRCSPKQEHLLLFSEMNMLRNLRNGMRFSPPFFNEKQLGSALDIVTDMYIFILAAEMENLEVL